MGRQSFDKRLEKLSDEVYNRLPQIYKDKRNEFYSVHRKIRSLKKKKLRLKNTIKDIDNDIRKSGIEFTTLYNELKILDSNHNPQMNVVFQRRRKVTTKGSKRNDTIKRIVEGQYNESFFIRIKFGKYNKSFHLSTKKNVIDKLSEYSDKITHNKRIDTLKFEILNLIQPIILDLVDFKDMNWFDKWNLTFNDVLDELERKSSSYNIF